MIKIDFHFHCIFLEHIYLQFVVQNTNIFFALTPRLLIGLVKLSQKMSFSF